jgi:hypothetical protein
MMEEREGSYRTYRGSALQRGQYRIGFDIPAGALPPGLAGRDQLVGINGAATGGETRRVYVHKLDAIAFSGRPVRAIAVVSILDAPLAPADVARATVVALTGVDTGLRIRAVEVLAQPWGLRSLVTVGASVLALFGGLD